MGVSIKILQMFWDRDRDDAILTLFKIIIGTGSLNHLVT